MARLTVEDCLKRVKNRFELVLKAAKRARLLERGAEPRVPWDNDKPTVVALREISEGFLDAPEEKQTGEQERQPVISDEIESVIEEGPQGTTAETVETIEESEPKEEEVSPFSVAAPAAFGRTPVEKVEYLTVAVPPPAEQSSGSEAKSERDQEQE